MFKKSLEGFLKLDLKNQDVPKYPTEFGAEDNKISNGDYNFSATEALYDDPATPKMSADGDGEYDLKAISGFIDINKHGEAEPETNAEEDEAVS